MIKELNVFDKMIIDNKFIQIPETVYKSGISTRACLVYGLIYAFSQKKGYCFARNITLQKELSISKPTLERCYSDLIKSGFLKREFVEDSLGKSIRKLTPLIITKKSKMIPNGIKNDIQKGIKNDTDYNNNSNNKKNKLINEFSFKSKLEKEIMDSLINVIECINKRHLRKSDFKIEDGERTFDKYLFKTFKEFLGHENFDSIKQIDDKFYTYLGHFYHFLKNKILRTRKRYYPRRFENYDLKGAKFINSKHNNFDIIKFKEELMTNDEFDNEKDSVLNWININE